MSLLMHNTMRITDGHLDEFRAAIERAVAFVERHGPQLMVQVFLDEERMLAHSFQLYPDSEAVRVHWRLSDPYISDVMEHCTVDHLTLYGDPDDDVRAGIAQVSRSVVPRMTGFVRPLRQDGGPGPGEVPRRSVVHNRIGRDKKESPMAEPIYSTEATSTAGREGRVTTDDGFIDQNLRMPPELGGPGGGTNPEQLFAAAYATCFQGAIGLVAGKEKTTVPEGTSVTASVELEPDDVSFHIIAAITAHLPGMDQSEADELVEAAHQACPYSKAIRGNVDVTLTAIV